MPSHKLLSSQSPSTGSDQEYKRDGVICNCAITGVVLAMMMAVATQVRQWRKANEKVQSVDATLKSPASSTLKKKCNCFMDVKL